MRYIFFFLSAIVLASCQEPQYPEGFLKHTEVVNAGMEELINEKLTMLNLVAAEHKKLKQARDYARFYRKNTYYLIDKDTKEPDSLIFWRLTKSKEANKFGYKSGLDSSIIFGKDSIMRKTALLYNLHEYTIQIYRSYSYCGIIFGSIPVQDPKDSNKIYLHGVPPEGSELSILISHADELTSDTADTIPVWATLTLNPN